MNLKTAGKRGKFVLLAVAALLSFAYAASFSLLESNPPSTTSVYAQGISFPSILSASLEPFKVRPGGSMQISAQISDPSGVSSVSTGTGSSEPSFFISMLHYTGWWIHG